MSVALRLLSLTFLSLLSLISLLVSFCDCLCLFGEFSFLFGLGKYCDKSLFSRERGNRALVIML